MKIVSYLASLFFFKALSLFNVCISWSIFTKKTRPNIVGFTTRNRWYYCARHARGIVPEIPAFTSRPLNNVSLIFPTSCIRLYLLSPGSRNLAPPSSWRNNRESKGAHPLRRAGAVQNEFRMKCVIQPRWRYDQQV